MATLSLSICLLFVLCSALLIPGHAYRSLSKNHVALFIFGDSLFDAGNNNYINTTIQFKANFRPYGETFFHYPTGRVSNGRLIPDFIAEYAKLPFIPTFLPSYKCDKFIHGVNFAAGGAGALVETYKGMVINLKTQLSYFKIVVEKQLKQELGDEGAETLLSKAVYLFSIGNNDVLSFATNKSVLSGQYSKEDYIGMVIGNVTSTIGEIYKKGGRKFGFVNLLPCGCLPTTRALVPGNTGSCLEIASELAELYNKALYKVLQELKSQLKGFSYSIHDLYNSLLKRINDPPRYGFKEGVMACCGSGPYRGILSCGREKKNEYELCDNPAEYVIFDSVHPTERAYKQIAELFWSGTPDVTRPYNLKKLFKKC